MVSSVEDETKIHRKSPTLRTEGYAGIQSIGGTVHSVENLTNESDECVSV